MKGLSGAGDTWPADQLLAAVAAALGSIFTLSCFKSLARQKGF